MWLFPACCKLQYSTEQYPRERCLDSGFLTVQYSTVLHLTQLRLAADNSALFSQTSLGTSACLLDSLPPSLPWAASANSCVLVSVALTVIRLLHS